jgi:hypothetical protein
MVAMQQDGELLCMLSAEKGAAPRILRTSSLVALRFLDSLAKHVCPKFIVSTLDPPLVFAGHGEQPPARCYFFQLLSRILD